MLLPAVIQLKSMLPEPEKLAEMGVRLAFTIAAAWLLQRALFLVVGRIERWLVRHAHDQVHAVQRARTLGYTARHLVTMVVSLAAAIHALEVLGWDVKPLLVGASILGAALGFGAQFLVRDVIAGVFILIEDQYIVGDVIELNGQTATVEAVTLRSTRMRDFQGRLMFVPNGEMKIVTNHSRGWRRVVVDLPVGPDQDLRRAIDVCQAAARELSRDPAWKERLLEPAEVLGIERIGAQEAVVRMLIRAQPGADGAEAARALRLLAHQRLMEAGLRLAPIQNLAATPAAETGVPPETTT